MQCAFIFQGKLIFNTFFPEYILVIVYYSPQKVYFNVWCNAFLFFQGKRIGKKKKTSVKSCNLNPYWNESFVFLIDEMDMKRVWLDVTVY